MKIAVILCIYLYMGVHVCICTDIHIFVSQQAVGDKRLCFTTVGLILL